jgi:hypothetical protein
VLYDELVIICGDDDASGSFARDSSEPAYVDTEGDEVGDDLLGGELPNTGTPVSDAHPMETSSPAEPSQSSVAGRKGKRRATTVDVMERLVERVGDVADSIRQLKADTVDRGILFQALLDLKDEVNMSEDQVMTVFDTMVENDKMALGFISKPPHYRKAWIVKFFMERTARHPHI